MAPELPLVTSTTRYTLRFATLYKAPTVLTIEVLLTEEVGESLSWSPESMDDSIRIKLGEPDETNKKCGEFLKSLVCLSRCWKRNAP